MHVYLLRHGEAGSAASDAARRLTPRGQTDIRAVAVVLAKSPSRPAMIWHSPLVRARESAELVAASLKPRPPLEACEWLRPGAEPRQARERIEAASEPLLLVGHLPHLERLVASIVVGDESAEIVALGTAALVGLRRAGAGFQLVALVPAGLLPAPPGPLVGEAD